MLSPVYTRSAKILCVYVHVRIPILILLSCIPIFVSAITKWVGKRQLEILFRTRALYTPAYISFVKLK